MKVVLYGNRYQQTLVLLSEFEVEVLLLYAPPLPLLTTVGGLIHMDELYRFHSSTSYPPSIHSTGFLGDGLHDDHQQLALVHDQDAAVLELEMSDLIKAQIANHPLYPNLLSAYIDCRKVGAPPEMASILEEISKENHPTISPTSTEIGTDPELDDFMKSYCEALQKYKEELSKPFDEATNFLSSIESQLTHLCKQTLPSSTTNSNQSPGRGSEEEMSGGDEEVEGGGCSSSGNNGEGDEELKEMLMRKYSGYLSSLRKEFLKKRKKGKLPKDAISALLDWWNSHYRWPYPTEEEKNRLSEMTGLDQKQINNWFINQRKRHWRPSEDMRFALMEGLSHDASVFFDPTR